MVKIISIRDDVYEELSKRKKDRSFSLVIRELLEETKGEISDLSKFRGTLSDEAAGIKGVVNEGRSREAQRRIKGL
ncbi:MAG: antitoxin VapB family protein [Nitrososphaerota archaeon]|jgi:predicted CopG family antitoxin|nr:antitoxin VapB family protein [Nitrososphaerota archaeon]MDG7038117.1 antitoxin VapB family protein [Nitrososphaerota archaeon]